MTGYEDGNTNGFYGNLKLTFSEANKSFTVYSRTNDWKTALKVSEDVVFSFVS